MFSRHHFLFWSVFSFCSKKYETLIEDVALSLWFPNCGVARAPHMESFTRERMFQILELQILLRLHTDKPNDVVYL